MDSHLRPVVCSEAPVPVIIGADGFNLPQWRGAVSRMCLIATTEAM